MKDGDRLTLSVTEAANACGLSERTLRELIRKHEFPAIRVGRRVLVIRTQLETWLSNQTVPV